LTLAGPAFDPDEFERNRAKTFLWCGVLFGGTLGGFLGLRYFLDLRMAGALGIIGAGLLGWASYQWGDPAWEWLGRNLWWFS
jgi:hypothetical protein